MKNFLFTILMLLTLSAIAQTKVYHPFPDSSSIWNIDSYQWCGLGFDNWEHLYSITISGDTVIGSVNYHKLEVPIEVVKSNGYCAASGSWTIPGYYVGSIREDTSNKKVFIVPPTTTIEELLYDFNMIVGDTVKGYIDPYHINIVQSVDSVLVGSTYRKRWNINTCNNIQFVEGIGSTYGLIEQSPGCIVDGPNYTISCFHQNGKILYPNTTMNCEIITSVNAIEDNLSQVNVFPNPSNGNFVLESSSTKKIVQIFDFVGKLMLTRDIKGEKTIVDASNLAQGVYNVCVSGSVGRINKRLVIIK